MVVREAFLIRLPSGKLSDAAVRAALNARSSMSRAPTEALVNDPYLDRLCRRYSPKWLRSQWKEQPPAHGSRPTSTDLLGIP